MAGRQVSIHIDDHELGQLEIDLTEAPGRMQRASRKTIKRAAEIVDRAMKRDARGHRYLPHFPRAITHEVIGSYDAEIGFEPIKGTQGKLAHIILHGSINNAPVYDYTSALRRSTPEILEMYAEAAEGATLGSEQA